MGSSPTVGAMSKKTYKSYVVVGTDENEGGYLQLSFSRFEEPRWVAYYGNATMFVDPSQADHFAETQGGIVMARTVTDEVDS